MEIGPVRAIRPAVMVKHVTDTPDLTGVFAVALRQQDENDHYSPGSASRGLEEDDATAAADDHAVDLSSGAQPATVNFFA